ncbi:MAG: hypothetical protein K2Q26_05005 [Bdellovibrionales bacterium]|nr:hypothetical protein [Bdellovibrionales bacterium]
MSRRLLSRIAVIAFLTPLIFAYRSSIAVEGIDSLKEMSSDNHPTLREDIEITNLLKKKIHHDYGLSHLARQITIKTHNGTVSLRGFVASRRDEVIILNYVIFMVGKDNYENDLEIISESL